MKEIGYSFNIKDILVIFVVGVFQFQMTSITTKLNGIENSLVKELIEMEHIKTIQQSQGEDFLFLRNELKLVDAKLSKHIEFDKPSKN